MNKRIALFLLFAPLWAVKDKENPPNQAAVKQNPASPGQGSVQKDYLSSEENIVISLFDSSSRRKYGALLEELQTKYNNSLDKKEWDIRKYADFLSKYLTAAKKYLCCMRPSDKKPSYLGYTGIFALECDCLIWNRVADALEHQPRNHVKIFGVEDLENYIKLVQGAIKDCEDALFRNPRLFMINEINQDPGMVQEFIDKSKQSLQLLLNEDLSYRAIVNLDGNGELFVYKDYAHNRDKPMMEAMKAAYQKIDKDSKDIRETLTAVIKMVASGDLLEKNFDPCSTEQGIVFVRLQEMDLEIKRMDPQRSFKERIPVDGMVNKMTDYLELYLEYLSPSNQALAVTKGLNFLGMESMDKLLAARGAYTFYMGKEYKPRINYYDKRLDQMVYSTSTRIKSVMDALCKFTVSNPFLTITYFGSSEDLKNAGSYISILPLQQKKERLLFPPEQKLEETKKVIQKPALNP